MGEPRLFGAHALRFTLPENVDRAGLLAALQGISGVHDVVLAEGTGAVLGQGDARALVSDVAKVLAARHPRARGTARSHVVPVVYDGADLDAVAAAVGTSRADVVARHTASDLEVAMMGFVPGFAYLRGLDPKLHLPRRSPRARVPEGSVAIAAGYSAIYPFASPGGWSLLGRAAFAPFDDLGATLALGDHVRFAAVDALPDRPQEVVLATASRTDLHVEALGGPALVVDAGRFGHAHEGLPASGPLVPSAMAAANHAAGNAGGTCAIEHYGSITVRAGIALVLADRHGARALRPGDRYVAKREPSERVAYLAIRGGIDVPVVLGSRTTLLVAKLGGHCGRWLVRGDALAIGEEDARDGGTLHVDDAIRVDPGPDAIDGALEAITTCAFRIAPSSDRTGTRLEGPPLPADPEPTRPSMPMVRGAIQLTPSGFVVMGPDHPVTGGYPVVATIPSGSLDRLFSRPLGAVVHFET